MDDAFVTHSGTQPARSASTAAALGGVTFDRPIVIVGAPRSGTTMLGRLFMSHRQVCFLDEWRLTWKFGNDRRSDVLRPEHATPRVIAHIRARFAAEVARQGKSRLVEKTPSNALRLPFVDRVLPEARYVHIIRNGYDSARSIRRFWEGKAHGVTGLAEGRVSHRLSEVGLLRLPWYGREIARRLLPASLGRALLGRAEWGPRLPGMSRMLRDMHIAEVCALQWRTCVELACHFGRSLPTHRYIELRLDRMDRAALSRLLAFCELDEDDGVRDFFENRYSMHQPRAEREQADEAELALIRAWIEPTMRWLGFEHDAGSARVRDDHPAGHHMGGAS